MKTVAAIICLACCCSAACLPIDQAASKIGSISCVAGKVVRVSQGPRGVQYIDFCDDHAKCAFSGVVFANDLRDVGDIRTLTGKTVEIHGKIREYDNHAEIIVSQSRQLRGDGVSLPPVPKEYDVEQRGHFSAGSSTRVKEPKKSKKVRQPPLPPGGVQVPTDPEN